MVGGTGIEPVTLAVCTRGKRQPANYLALSDGIAALAVSLEKRRVVPSRKLCRSRARPWLLCSMTLRDAGSELVPQFMVNIEAISERFGNPY